MKIAVLAVIAAAVARPAAAVTLNFDTPYATQLTSYGRFYFTNFYTLDTAGFPSSGYDNGVVSTPNVAYNGGGTAASISARSPFSLSSGYVTAAWNDGLTVQLVGSLGGSTVFAQSFTVSTANATFEAFDSALIDTVVFTSSGGTHHAGYDAGDGTNLSLTI